METLKAQTVALLASILPALGLVSCGGSNVAHFVSLKAPVVALTHVRVIDGTGTPARDDQTLVIEADRIAAMGRASDVRIPTGAHTVDLRGRTVIPGLVGMHEHLFYEMGSAGWSGPAQASFAMLYLASGVTTIRTAGTVDFTGDLRIKRLIDAGRRPGPAIHVTSPYLNARPGAPDPDRIARDVASWADQGATSFKAYTSLRAEELKAAIHAAHERGLKVTGHLCAVGFQEAAGLGIDNLEHGLLVDTEFYSGKKRDECPDWGASAGELQSMDVSGPAIRQMISALVRRGVAITSTLAVFETLTPEAQLDYRTLLTLTPRRQDEYRAEQTRRADPGAPGGRAWSRLLRKEMEFERAFVAAGGRLVAGVDPTGWGGVVAGFGDQRQVELLVDAGLTPEFAIRVATANGAALLNEPEIGVVAVGLRADLVVVRGDPSANISDIRNVEIVFKNGTGYDPQNLIAAARGTVGQFDIGRLNRSPYVPLLLGLLAFMVVRRLAGRYRSDRRR